MEFNFNQAAFAARLKAARHAAGVSAAQAAALIGVSRSVLLRYEQTGKAAIVPPLRSLVILCLAYGASSDILLGIKK